MSSMKASLPPLEIELLPVAAAADGRTGG